MSQTLRYFFTLSVLCLYGLTMPGCGNKTAPETSTSTAGENAAHDHDDHDDHDEHDHPEHGAHGGHMVELSDGSDVEVMFADDLDLFTIWVDDPDKVKKVEMITTINGDESSYSFEEISADSDTVFGLTNPELATAAQMGKGVDVQVVITYEDRELTGKFEHHAH